MAQCVCGTRRCANWQSCSCTHTLPVTVTALACRDKPFQKSLRAVSEDSILPELRPGALLDASGLRAEHHDSFLVVIVLSQMLGLECRAALPNGVAALSVAASPQVILSGWSDGCIHCHSRGGATYSRTGPQQQQGAPLWCIPNAHVRAHACGVTALQLSNRCVNCSSDYSVGG